MQEVGTVVAAVSFLRDGKFEKNALRFGGLSGMHYFCQQKPTSISYGIGSTTAGTALSEFRAGFQVLQKAETRMAGPDGSCSDTGRRRDSPQAGSIVC